MNDAPSWSPKHIDIELTFDAFVPSFRNGQLIRAVMSDTGKTPPNADYVFSADNIIAELKCLEKNPTESADWPPRLAKAFGSTGHSFSDLMGYLVRGAPMPVTVRAKLFHWMRDAIRTVIKGGNRQIRSSKRELGRPDAKGLLLVANDHNYGFGPEGMLAVISDAVARLDNSHVDAVVYFTPNVFHRKPDSDVAWMLWDPIYRDMDDVLLSEFVNDMGRKWGDHLESVTGDPLVEWEEHPEISLSSMQPVRRLGRQR
jgi:hypothetical protein